MTEGYVLLVSGADSYFEMTLCLAASIRYHGDKRPISVMTDNVNHPLIQDKIFDKIIPLSPYRKEVIEQTGETSGIYKRKGIPAYMLYSCNPYDKCISIDSDCMAVSNTDKLWEVFSTHELTFTGHRRAEKGWGTMTDEDIVNAEVQIENDLLKIEKRAVQVCLREVHGGLMWWKKDSRLKHAFMREIISAINHKRLYRYFDKVVGLWGGIISNEVVLSYVSSILNVPVIEYNKNLIGVNPEIFSVKDGRGDMGIFLTDKRMKSLMNYENGTPVIEHFFQKTEHKSYRENKEFLMNYLKRGPIVDFHISDLDAYDNKFFQENKVCGLDRARGIIPILKEALDFKSMIDVGCSVGHHLQGCIENGINDVFGVEGSLNAINNLCVDRKMVKHHDLRLPLELGRKWDIALSIEVIEHIEKEYESVFLQSLAGCSDTIVITAAQPGQGGIRHFNEQKKEYWVDKFDRIGYCYDISMVEKINGMIQKAIDENKYTHWWRNVLVMIFKKKEHCDN